MNPLVGVIRQAWSVYREHAGHLLPLALLVALVSALVEAVLAGLLGWVGAALAAVVALVATFLLQSALVKAVEDVLDGRADLSFGETLRAAQPFILRVAAASVLAGLAIGLGLILLIVPGLFLLTIWCLIVPVIVLEGAGIGRAFGRSQELVRGFGWQVFGTLALVYLLLLAVNIVLGIVLAVLPDAARGFISSVASVTLVSPYIALVVTLGYFRLRDAHGGNTPPQFSPPQAPLS